MSFISQLFIGRSEFADEQYITKYVSNSKNYKDNFENIDQAKALLIFSTSKQRTWLVATSARLYCILDDIRKDKPHINWSIGKPKLIHDNKLIVSITYREKSKYTGVVDIGADHKGWLFSKKLFNDDNIKDSIMTLISEQMDI